MKHTMVQNITKNLRDLRALRGYLYFQIIELLAKITFLQEAPKMEIANLLWYKE